MKTKVEKIVPIESNGSVATARPAVEIGPATLQIFADVLAASQISQAQLITLLEARGLTGNYRLVVTAACVVPVEEGPPKNDQR